MSHVLLSPELMSMPLDNPELVEPAIRAFAQIAKAWSLTDVQQSEILGRPVDTALAVLSTDADGDSLSETMTRIGCVLGIYRALHTIFPSRQQADRWVHSPNSGVLFNGAPAVTLMCSGRLEDLVRLREYLNEQGLDEP